MTKAEEQIATHRNLSRSLRSKIFFVAVGLFAFALLVRLVGIKWGLPVEHRWYSYHPDERDIAGAVAQLDFFSGQINPHFYNYPSLFIYATYLAHTIAVMGGLTHQVAPGDTSVWPFLHDIILAGRLVSAVLGAATVSLVYAIGRRLLNPAAAVLAALLIGLAPGHVQHSHFATVDAPAAFFVTLALWLAILACDDNANLNHDETELRHRNRLLWWAAAAAGLAAATKYNAGLVIIAPFAAMMLNNRSHRRPLSKSAGTALGLVGVAGLTFVIGCPGSVLYTREFLGTGQYSGLLYELFVHSREGSGDIFVGSGNGWWYHLTFNLPFLMTWPTLLAGLGGALSVALAARRSAPANGPSLPPRATLIVVAWLALAFGATGLSQVRFMRYMLPLVPALCVLAAIMVWPTRELVRKTGAAYATATAAILIVAALGTYNVLYNFVATDPRDEAAVYLAQQVTSPTTIGLVEPPWFWSPPLSPQDAPAFRGTPPAPTSPDGKFRFIFTGLESEQIAAQKPAWFVWSEFEWTNKERLRDAQFEKFTGVLNREYKLVRRFKHHPPLTLPGRSFVPHDFLYTNPEVRLYKRNAAN